MHLQTKSRFRSKNIACIRDKFPEYEVTSRVEKSYQKAKKEEKEGKLISIKSIL